jgi:transposase
LKQPEFVNTTREQLDALVVLASSFPPEQLELFKHVLDSFVYVMQELQGAKASVTRLRKMLFGKFTESRANILKSLGKDDVQDTNPAAAGTAVAPSPDTGDQKKRQCKGHGRNGAAAYKGAQVIEIPVPGLKSGDPCPKCPDGKVYYAPPKVLVKVVGNPPLTATIFNCGCLRCRLCDYSISAPLPVGMSTAKYDPSCAIVLGILHYGCGMPFYRLDWLQSSMAIPMPKSTQWEILDKFAGGAPKIAYEAMIVRAAQGRVLHNDDTTTGILDLMGKRRAKAEAAGKDLPRLKAIYTTGIVSLVDDVQVILFLTGPAHSGMNMEKVLAHRAEGLPLPTQMCDALTANTKGDFLAFLALCLAHARRQFVDVASSFPDACCHVIEVFAEVYRIDHETKDLGMSDAARLEHHRTHSRPLMVALKKWMRKLLADHEVEPNSGLGKAMRYMLKHWMGLTLFYRKAGVPLDNNIAERILKKAIIYRNNSYFYRTQHGADVGDIFMSLIFTCEACKANPFDYLQALQIHGAEVAAQPYRWLPWNYGEALAEITRPPPTHVAPPRYVTPLPAYAAASARAMPPPAVCAREPAHSPA